MSFTIPVPLEAAIDELISHYPQKRSAALMLLHAVQEHAGHLPGEAVDWIARKLDLQPINILELVTFYPMFRRDPAGKHQLRICRTLSCALGGSHELHRQVCAGLGLNPAKHGLQTTVDGKFSVEFVECLASCGTAPVMLCGDTLHEKVTAAQAAEILEKCR